MLNKKQPRELALWGRVSSRTSVFTLLLAVPARAVCVTQHRTTVSNVKGRLFALILIPQTASSLSSLIARTTEAHMCSRIYTRRRRTEKQRRRRLTDRGCRRRCCSCRCRRQHRRRGAATASTAAAAAATAPLRSASLTCDRRGCNSSTSSAPCHASSSSRHASCPCPSPWPPPSSARADRSGYACRRA